jgi:hypothetical protein
MSEIMLTWDSSFQTQETVFEMSLAWVGPLFHQLAITQIAATWVLSSLGRRWHHMRVEHIHAMIQLVDFSFGKSTTVLTTN